jgi:uncharacterized protein (TIGR02145 family)
MEGSGGDGRFGFVDIGTSDDDELIITNSSTSTDNLNGNLQVTGIGFSIFSGGSNFSLSPGQSKSFIIRFSPTELVPYSGLLVIDCNATNFTNPISISLSGTGMGKILDYDNNTYNTIPIGTQVWMKENLRTIHYNDGSAIELETDDQVWSYKSSGAYCWYLNDQTTYRMPYGALYNWHAVNTGKLCPTGWRVPTRTDLINLLSYLGGNEAAYAKLKSTARWPDGENGNNISGFTAYPGGERDFLYGYYLLGTDGFWWSATSYDADQVWYLYIGSGFYSYVDILRTNKKVNGASVRCIKN